MAHPHPSRYTQRLGGQGKIYLLYRNTEHFFFQNCAINFRGFGMNAVQGNGEVVQLDDKTGTNTLGELIEASQWSADKLFYGDLHNFGHIAMCYIHDPDRSHSVLN